jgi:transposase
LLIRSLARKDPSYYAVGMAMGTRHHEQSSLWVATNDLPKSQGHPFYMRLNALLDTDGFDRFVERECREFYATVMGRPSLAPGCYFRLLLLGYFEGIDSERGIAWRATDSLAVRGFLRLALEDPPPDHSTISRTRRLIDLDTHRAVFTWVLERVAEAGLLNGKTVAIDATTLEANAAMRSIVRRDTGASYEQFLTGLAKASGIETPTREQLARLDRKRKKKTPNKDWTNPHDPDAKITKMKDRRTHLAHKAEHAVDLETGAVVAVTLQGADHGDTTTIEQTLAEAVEQLDAVADATDAEVETAPEVVTDKGYHSRGTVLDLETNGFRTYISEPARGPQSWNQQQDARDAVYANRRRARGDRGRRLLRRRGEYVERTFAHVYDTGGMRRTHLRGHTNILKRLLIHVAGFNLGLVMRHLIGLGTPRGLQGRVAAVIAALLVLLADARARVSAIYATDRVIIARRRSLGYLANLAVNSSTNVTYTTRC